MGQLPAMINTFPPGSWWNQFTPEEMNLLLNQQWGVPQPEVLRSMMGQGQPFGGVQQPGLPQAGGLTQLINDLRGINWTPQPQQPPVPDASALASPTPLPSLFGGSQVLPQPPVPIVQQRQGPQLPDAVIEQARQALELQAAEEARRRQAAEIMRTTPDMGRDTTNVAGYNPMPLASSLYRGSSPEAYLALALEAKEAANEGQALGHPGSWFGPMVGRLDAEGNPIEIPRPPELVPHPSFELTDQQKENIKARKDKRATAQQLISARARGQSPSGYRADIGTATPADLALLGGAAVGELHPDVIEQKGELAKMLAEIAAQAEVDKAVAQAKGVALGAGAKPREVQSTLGAGLAAEGGALPPMTDEELQTTFNAHPNDPDGFEDAVVAITDDPIFALQMRQKYYPKGKPGLVERATKQMTTEYPALKPMEPYMPRTLDVLSGLAPSNWWISPLMALLRKPWASTTTSAKPTAAAASSGWRPSR